VPDQALLLQFGQRLELPEAKVATPGERPVATDLRL
jgi:hypothetical protein